MSMKPPRPFPGKKQVRIIVLLTVLATLAACATTQSAQQIDRLESVKENPRVVLMPPDIRYYLLTAGGIPEGGQGGLRHRQAEMVDKGRSP